MSKFYEFGSIAGVVILYNPEENVVVNIGSYINQVNFLYIVDNSEKTFRFITEFISKNNHKIEYIFNNRNLGVAAALNIAAKKAFEAGYLYLLTMDQDSKAPIDLVKVLYEGIKQKENIGIISPFHDNKFHTKIPLELKYNKVLDVMTSGNLLNLSAYKEVGDFNEDFFIDYVDIEYCLRLNLKNFDVIQANVLLEHNEANVTKKKFFLKDIHPSNHSPIRFYYKARNRLYLRKKYKHLFSDFFKIENHMFWATLFKALIYEDNKILKLKMAFHGHLDYFKKRIGCITQSLSINTSKK